MGQGKAAWTEQGRRATAGGPSRAGPQGGRAGQRRSGLSGSPQAGARGAAGV